MSWFSFQFNDFAFSFISVLFEGVPFVLLGSLISGFVDVFVSSERISRMLPRNRSGAIFLSGLLGLVLPMCECGSVIIIRRFIKKGLPLSAAVTYMLAAPIVSPVVALSTYAAFKGQGPVVMTSLRLSIGFAIAVAIGFIVSRCRPATILQPDVLGEGGPRQRAGLSIAAAPTAREFTALVETATLRQKLVLAVQSATSDLLDVTFFLIIGAATASVFNTAINQEVILPYAGNPPVAIVAMMVLAAALALCSTTDAFIAASFASFPFAAKLGFLLFGPLFDIKLFWLYGLIFKRRYVALTALGLFVTIGLICWRIAGLQL
ncbi:MAG TPA: permease [Chthoniobacteraceae bacterium]|jgi:uncharacterized membrane protein YraQ (UPF0718 family)|nr:Permease [Chthoniobacter sp.]HEV7869351.1 permease [Chthoniobacteraceae bacterium]